MAKRNRRRDHIDWQKAQRIGTPRVGVAPPSPYTTPLTPGLRDPGKFGGAFGATPGKRFGVFNPPPNFGRAPAVDPQSTIPGGPPPGTYDPQLDSQLRASDRGIDAFRQDTRRAGVRAVEDYKIAQEDAAIARTRGRRDLGTALKSTWEDYMTAGGDIGREYDRSMFDVGTQRTRTNEDYGRAVQTQERNYGILGSRQGQAAQAAGVAGGGALAQAAAKRAGNMAFERQDMDTSLGRTLKDLDLSETRLGENRDRSLSGLNTSTTRALEANQTQGRRLEQDFNRLLGPQGSPQSGRLYQQWNRGVEDRQRALERAERENREFGLDVGNTMYYQARYGAGTLPIWRPARGGPRRRDPYAPPRGGRR